MGLQIGIVGLPNVGKSTLFNALTKSKGAEVANYPFCTINPNVGVVEVPDERLQALASVVHPEKIIPAIVEFVDIAGLVKGAASGEGLGNQFLANIRACDAILQVVRVFEDRDIQHVHERIDPKSDIEVINAELCLKDLETVQKAVHEIDKKVRAGDKEAAQRKQTLERLLEGISKGILAIDLDFSSDEKHLLKDLGLLTFKPILYAANVGEKEVSSIDLSALKKRSGLSEEATIIPVSAKVEEELNSLGPEDAKIFLQDLGLKESTLNALIRKAYDVLGLQTYFTAGVKEVRAWTVHKGSKAPQAAGVIHTDFEKGFIRAEIVDWKDFVQQGGESKCRELGKLRTEGKDYVMREGDVVHFLFNV